jgi:hypothetical protein
MGNTGAGNVNLAFPYTLSVRNYLAVKYIHKPIDFAIGASCFY